MASIWPVNPSTEPAHIAPATRDTPADPKARMRERRRTVARYCPQQSREPRIPGRATAASRPLAAASRTSSELDILGRSQSAVFVEEQRGGAAFRGHGSRLGGEWDVGGQSSVLVRHGKGGKCREVCVDEWAGTPTSVACRTCRAASRSAVLVIDGPTCGRPWSSAAPLRAPPGSPPRLVSGAGSRRTSAPRARARAGPRGRPAQRDAAPARARQPRHHADLPTRNRPRGDHRHRPYTTRADDGRRRRPGALNNPTTSTAGAPRRSRFVLRNQQRRAASRRPLAGRPERVSAAPPTRRALSRSYVFREPPPPIGRGSASELFVTYVEVELGERTDRVEGP